VHAVLGDVVALHRQEGARAHVQGDEPRLDAARLQPVHQLRREVQAGGRRRHRTFDACEHGLIVGAVALILRPLRGDVGRQRHQPVRGDRLVQQRPRQVEGERDLSALALPKDGRVEAGPLAGAFGRAAETDPVAGTQPFAGAHEGRPAVRREPLVQGRLDLDERAVAVAYAVQPRRDHAGVVEHQHVARPQQVGQVRHPAILQALAPHHQQARGAPRLGGPERDGGVRQFEIKVG
jgi:hypothetical protein